jgi:hypothetical protein
MRLKKSTFDCLVEQTLDATTVVDFVPRGVDLRCKKPKALSVSKIEYKLEKLVLPPEWAQDCDRSRLEIATTEVDLCHLSGLGCDR